jgi:nucleoside-diphosphate-sugar epimerase
VTLVLVTGATGFVGRQVLRRFAEIGVPVRIVARSDAFELPTGLSLESLVKTSDLFSETEEWWTRASQGVDVAVHLAWYAEPGSYQLSERNIDCLRGTLTMARGFVAGGGKRFVGIGTCAEYDLGGGDVSVATSLKPQTPYAGAKAATFLALSSWLQTMNVDFAWCRLFYLYGEGEDGRRLVPYIRSRLAAAEAAELTHGNQVRDFLDVRDAGRMIADVALSRVIGPYNVCSGTPLTVRALAERLGDEYGRRDLLKFGARAENSFDPPRVVGVPGHEL